MTGAAAARAVPAAAGIGEVPGVLAGVVLDGPAAARPARREAAASRSPIPPGRIGAPTGPRNRFTSTKSLPAARGMVIRSSA